MQQSLGRGASPFVVFLLLGLLVLFHSGPKITNLLDVYFFCLFLISLAIPIYPEKFESLGISPVSNSSCCLVFSLLSIIFGFRWSVNSEFANLMALLLIIYSSSHMLFSYYSELLEINPLQILAEPTSIIYSPTIFLISFNKYSFFGETSLQWTLIIFLCSVHFSYIFVNSKVHDLENYNPKSPLILFSIFTGFFILGVYDFSSLSETRDHVWWGLGAYSTLGRGLVEFGFTATCTELNYNSCWIYPSNWWAPPTFVAAISIWLGIEPIWTLRISVILLKIASGIVLLKILNRLEFPSFVSATTIFVYFSMPYVAFYGRELSNWPFIELWFLLLIYVFMEDLLQEDIKQLNFKFWGTLLLGILILGWQAAALGCFLGATLLIYNGFSRQSSLPLVFGIFSGLASLFLWSSFLNRFDPDGIDTLFKSAENRSGSFESYGLENLLEVLISQTPLIGPISIASIIAIILISQRKESFTDFIRSERLFLILMPFVFLSISKIFLFAELVSSHNSALPSLAIFSALSFALVCKELDSRVIIAVVVVGTLANLHEFYDLNHENKHSYTKNLQELMGVFDEDGTIVIDESVRNDTISYYYSGIDSILIGLDGETHNYSELFFRENVALVVVSNTTAENFGISESTLGSNWCQEVIEMDNSYIYNQHDYFWYAYSKC